MPTFQKLDPKDVQVGKGRLAAEQRQPFIEALRAGNAGKIELQGDDRPQIVKRRLTEASRETSIRVRSSWDDKSQRVLLWKRIGK